MNSYSLIKQIDISGSKTIFCALNKNILLTGDENKRIMQWEIKDDNLKFISVKETAHNADIYTLLQLGNNNFLSGSVDKLVKIW